MKEVFNNLKKLYNKYHPAQFNMAIAQLMEVGFHDAAEITDEEIESAKGNALMTDEFWQNTLKLVREIAKNYKPIEFIMFCEIEEPLNVSGFSNHPTRDDLEKYMERAIWVMRDNGGKDKEIIEFCDITEDDADFFDLEYPYDEEEE